MKINKLTYMVFISAFLVVNACSEKSMNRAENMSEKDSLSYSDDNREIELNFSTDTLSDKQKELFSIRAIQKVEDYYSYLEIISNKKYDTILRNHAKTIVKELFLEKKEIQLTLDSITGSSADSLEITINTISISRSPQAVNDSMYEGSIEFEEQLYNHEKKIRHMDFIIKKIRKKFGSEQNLVWKTYLNLQK